MYLRDFYKRLKDLPYRPLPLTGVIHTAPPLLSPRDSYVFFFAAPVDRSWYELTQSRGGIVTRQKWKKDLLRSAYDYAKCLTKLRTPEGLCLGGTAPIPITKRPAWYQTALLRKPHWYNY